MVTRRTRLTDVQHWLNVVRQAPNEAALVAAVRDYLQSLPRESVAALPEAAHPGEVSCADDIATLNVMAVRAELLHAGDADTAALLRQMLTVLGEAVSRIASMSVDARLVRPGP